MTNKGKHIDQMMAALARKNQQHLDQYRDPASGEPRVQPRRGAGNVSGPKPLKKFSGRGR